MRHLMICERCGTENRAGRKFCGTCGAALAESCPACGTVAEPGDRFCGSCGGPLPGGADQASATATAPPGSRRSDQTAASGATERRVVSVLFVDLVGFTALSHDRDPEAVREFLDGYFAVAREQIARYGGTIEKFIGDAVMAVWGTPGHPRGRCRAMPFGPPSTCSTPCVSCTPRMAPRCRRALR